MLEYVLSIFTMHVFSFLCRRVRTSALGTVVFVFLVGQRERYLTVALISLSLIAATNGRFRVHTGHLLLWMPVGFLFFYQFCCKACLLCIDWKNCSLR